jgi:5'-deoxynucleotidase YfbR-like HD superfamily hydrolase
MSSQRAWILLPSGAQLDLLHPDPACWTDRDLAIGLSRTYRWAGYSRHWDLPLSVAQHSLTVLHLAQSAPGPVLSNAEARRELLHDATEALAGGFDCLTTLKPLLGAGYRELNDRLQAAVDVRYRLPAWTEQSYARHKAADRLAAASEGLHVAGWRRDELIEKLGITLAPLTHDPLSHPGFLPWEPWPPKIAAARFLAALETLSSEHDISVEMGEGADRKW